MQLLFVLLESHYNHVRISNVLLIFYNKVQQILNAVFPIADE